MKTIDARSEKNIATLTPEAKEKAMEWLAKVREKGINAVIIQGTRTWQEQDELYAQGRTEKGPKVTNARGGYSVHNYGMAWDFVVFEDVSDNGGVGHALWDSPKMEEAGKIGESIGLEWGGSWKGFRDIPHLQMPGLDINALRAMMPRGWRPRPGIV